MGEQVGLNKNDSFYDNRLTVAVKTLPMQSKMVLWSIIDTIQSGEVTPRIVYERYSSLCGAVDVKLLEQFKVISLIYELEMLGIVDTKRNKTIKKIKPVVHSNDLKELLFEALSLHE